MLYILEMTAPSRCCILTKGTYNATKVNKAILWVCLEFQLSGHIYIHLLIDFQDSTDAGHLSSLLSSSILEESQNSKSQTQAELTER